jgi:hypothetical protein
MLTEIEYGHWDIRGKADESAVGAINRPLRASGFINSAQVPLILSAILLKSFVFSSSHISPTATMPVKVPTKMLLW